MIAVATTRNPSRRGDDGRRTELIEAASRVVARDGIAAATTRRIAQEASVPPGLVHYWFAGKDELLQEVLTATLGAIQAAAAPGTGEHDLLDRLKAAFQVVTQDDRGGQIALYEMTTWALRNPEHTHMAQHQYTAYRRVATEAATSWIAESKAQLPAEAPVVGQFLSALFDGLVLAWLADPEHTDVDGVLTLVSTLMAQFVPQPSPI
jgi:DNA-binding transcriptional regulator YbjK